MAERNLETSSIHVLYRLLFSKPLYKLMITGRQAGRQADRQAEKATYRGTSLRSAQNCSLNHELNHS